MQNRSTNQAVQDTVQDTVADAVARERGELREDGWPEDAADRELVKRLWSLYVRSSTPDGPALPDLAPAAARQAGPPEYPADADGFAAVLIAARWELRWNTRARRPEARPKGGEWAECDGLVRDRMMTACEAAAVTRSGWRVEGWQIRGVRRETRLINVLAVERPEAGEGTAEYYAALEWLRMPRGRYLRLEDVFTGARLLQKYESPNRAPKRIREDVKTALQDSGWAWRSVRLAAGPRWRWCAPARVLPIRRPVSLRPSSFSA